MVWVCEELAWTCYGSVGMLSVRVRFDTLFSVIAIAVSLTFLALLSRCC